MHLINVDCTHVVTFFHQPRRGGGMWPAALWGIMEVARSNRKVGQQ